MKKEPDFKVNTDNIANSDEEPNTDFWDCFVHNLVETFKNGAAYLLEAKRIVNAENPQEELDLILNYEEESEAMMMKKRFPFFK